MDLVARGPNGRLDSLAACMLLWSGAVTLSGSNAPDTANGPTASIDTSVVSLHQLSYEEVAEVLPDLYDLIDVLESDEKLCTPANGLCHRVRETLLSEKLTGASLFLLQSGAHPLIVELAGRDRVRIRYDAWLAEDIPNLQELLCRLVCHLWFFRGSTRPVTIEFSMNAAKDGTRDTPILDSQVEIRQDEVLAVKPLHELSPTVPADDNVASTESEVLLLQTSLYATQELLSATNKRLEALEQKHSEVEAAKPNPNINTYHGRSLAGPTAQAKAARSIVIRSALYIGIGLALMWLGRICMTEQDRILELIESFWRELVTRVQDFMNLTLGLTQAIGVHDVIELPHDAIRSFLSVAGLVLMGLGIVFPVLKILKRTRIIRRELRHTQAHRSVIDELSAQQLRSAEAIYAQTLESWTSSMMATEHDIEFAKDSLNMLQAAERSAREACDRRGLAELPADVAPTSPARRSVALLVRSIDSLPSEDERHERIAEHCDEVADIVARSNAIA